MTESVCFTLVVCPVKWPKRTLLLKQLLPCFEVLSPPSGSSDSVLASFVNYVLSTTLFCLFTAMNCAVQIYLLQPCWRPICLHKKHQRMETFMVLPGVSRDFNYLVSQAWRRVLTYFTVIWRTAHVAWFIVKLLYGNDEVMLAML